MGWNLVLECGTPYRLFVRAGGLLHLIGTHESAGEALAALDADGRLW